MPYHQLEIDISDRYLEKICQELNRSKCEFCLLGGWAAYHIVNDNFQKINGRKYIGSRDIDIGFHIDKNWSKEQLKKSDFCTATHLVEGMGFKWISARLAKDFDWETGRELTLQESRSRPLYEIITIYVDPLVDCIHPQMKDALGSLPLDEPLLSSVFVNRICTRIHLLRTSVSLPKPHCLLAMKLNCVTTRGNQDKRIKDIADIFAILWFSNMEFAQIKDNLFFIYPRAKARKVVGGFKESEINAVSKEIGISADQIHTVLDQLI